MMTDDEMDALRRRFGDDVDQWPAPYRQAARRDPADGGLDALLRRAIDMPTDEPALARAVAARIARETQAGHSGGRTAAFGWLTPATAGACAAVVLALASVSGYALAGRGDALDAVVLQLASGGAIVDVDLGGDAL